MPLYTAQSGQLGHAIEGTSEIEVAIKFVQLWNESDHQVKLGQVILVGEKIFSTKDIATRAGISIKIEDKTG